MAGAVIYVGYLAVWVGVATALYFGLRAVKLI
ncbi:MAG: cytochrome b6-f complex subunit PetL [Phormidesmis sp.]